MKLGKLIPVCCLFALLITGCGKYNNGIYRGDENANGVPHGKGTIEFPDGGSYEGDWVDGLRHGQGTASFANGDVYVGEWQNDMMHGQGTLTLASGEVLSGTFANDEFIG